MKSIDIESWERKEYFLMYREGDFPYINVGASLDVTNLIRYCKARSLSSYLTLIFAAHQTAYGIENFRYRIKDGMPVMLEHMALTFTYVPEGSELFVNVTMDFHDDLETFHQAARERIAGQGTDSGLAALRERIDFIAYSAIPWIQYTHVVRTIAKLGADSNPKISWGKYFEQNGRTLAPFSVQVHHGLMDGLHVGRYFERIQDFIDRM